MATTEQQAIIRFNTTVSGDITNLEVTANGHPLDVKVENGEFSSRFVGKITKGRNLIIIYDITGLNGTDYSVSYSCTADNEKKSDPGHPSPVTGTITIGNHDTKTLTILI